MHDIVLLHGIRTQAFWFDVVQPTLEDIPDVNVIRIGYGYYDVFRFILPGFTRWRPQRIVAQELRTIISQNATKKLDRPLSVIAHSFGTYTIGRVLLENPDIKLHNLVLCGSVLPTSFDFARVKPQIANEILNEVGFRDPWPLIAKTISFGYGSSGTNGFGRANCRDRHHDVDHGSFFGFSYVHRYWRSLFASNTIVPSSFNRNATRRPWLITMMSKLPPSLLPGAILGSGLTYLLWLGSSWLGWR